MKSQTKLLITLTSLALLALGAGSGYYFAMRQMHSPISAMPSSETGKPKALYWYDPMVPAQHFDAPGKSPFMDMQLVPKYAAAGAEVGAETSVQIDAATLQNLGVRTALVEVSRADMSRQQAAITVPGMLSYDERAVSIEQARMAGFVERVFALAPGDVIRAGQPLAELTVPDWSAAQQEYLALRASGDAALMAAARERLRLVGMPDASIKALEKTGRAQQRFTIYSSRAGVILELPVRTGMSIIAGQTLARINGIESIWCEISVPEALAAELAVGAKASIQLTARPGANLLGTVDAILPALNEASRSVRLRIALNNPDGLLRPGMAATVQLQGQHADDSQADALTVPTEAVIRTGKRALVMREVGKGRFTPVEVTLGREIGARTVIVQGLSAGDSVVVSGQFLLDSEASLSGIGLHGKAGDAPERVASMSNSAATVSPLHEADATIIAIEADALKLAHGRFETLNMPGMTMSFGYADIAAMDTSGLKVGDAVRVWVREDKTGLVIERLEPRVTSPTKMVEPQ